MALMDGGKAGDRLPTFLGMPVKQVSLIMLTFQNSALIMILHYSRIMAPPGDHRYFPSTAVFLCEVLKFAISFTLAMHDSARRLLPSSSPPLPNTAASTATASTILSDIHRAVFSKDSWKLAVPAALYTVQNTLLYTAAGNLDSVNYQVLYQLKILTTALFSVFLLRRPLPPHRWAALVLLTLGLCVVSLLPTSESHRPIVLHDTSDHVFPRSAHEIAGIGSGMAKQLTRRAMDAIIGGIGVGARSTDHLAKRSASYQGIGDDEYGAPMNYPLGLSAVLTAATVSGLAGVFLESILKSTQHAHATSKSSAPNANIWTRNIQLSFYSLFAAGFGIIWRDGADIAVHGFFDGYTWVVWTVVVFQASEGLLASLCIQYADNIAKNFATSFSIILSFVFSVMFFDADTSFAFLFGTSLVLGSAYLYSMSPSYGSTLLSHVNRAPRPSPLRLITKNLRPDTLPMHVAGGGSNASTPQRLTPRMPNLNRVSSADTPRRSMTDEAGFLGVEPFGGAHAIGLSTSRPASPMVSRAPTARKRDD